MKIINLLIFATVILTGCTSGPLYKPESLSNPNNGAIYIYREAMFKGAGAKPSVFINGTYYGLLSTGSYVRAEVGAGEHTIEIGNKSQQGLMGWGLEPYFLKVNIASSEDYFYKFIIDDSDVDISVVQIGSVAAVSTSGKANVFLKAVKKEEAEKELNKYKKVLLKNH